MRTFSPVPPYQLLERVYTDVVGVHVLNVDVALLQVLLLDLVWMSRTTSEEQHYHEDGAVGVVWVCSWCIRRRPNRLGLCAI